MQAIAMLAVNNLIAGFFWVGGGASAILILKYGFKMTLF